MKTTKLFSVLSLAIIFAATTAGFSNGIDNRTSKASNMPGITYQVAIHLPGFIKDICNPYLVQILDENGRVVAPPQVFINGVTKYLFFEKAPVSGRTRMAVLIPVSYPNHYVCPNDLYTLPDVMTGPFNTGQTYTFDLYPAIEAPTPESNGTNGNIETRKEQ
jgi:hypothetical protein